MFMSGKLSIGLLVILVSTSYAENPMRIPPLTYFDQIDVETLDPDIFGVRITSVMPNCPAEIAGLRENDLVIGILGWRIRDPRELLLISVHNRHISIAPLTVIRSGELVEIRMPNPVARINPWFEAESSAPDIHAVLDLWSLDFEEITGHPLERIPDAPPASARNRLHGVAVQGRQRELRFMKKQPLMAMRALPARALEAMVDLGRTSQDESIRQTVRACLKVYVALLYERYDEAATLLSTHNLLTNKTGTFLDDLMAFYANVSDNPVGDDLRLPFESYGVDDFFFALCYPYPLIDLPDRPDAYAADSKFFDLLVKRSYATPAFRELLFSEALSLTGRRPGETNEEGYIRLNMAAALELQHQGGWPYRHSSLANTSRRDRIAMLSRLRDLLNENPDDVATALGLIAPSVVVNDIKTLENAFRVLRNAGPMAMAAGTRIACNTANFHRMDARSRLALLRSEREAGIWPSLYLALSNGGGYMLARMTHGFFVQNSEYMTDMNASCNSHPWMVANALKGNRAKESNHGEFTYDALIEHLSFYLTVDGIKELERALVGKSRGQVFDAILEITSGHAYVGSANSILLRKDHAITHLLNMTLGHSYEPFLEDLAGILTIDMSQSDFVDAMNGLYDRHATAFACLHIGQALNDAGLHAEAKRFTGKANSLYHSLWLIDWALRGGVRYHPSPSLRNVIISNLSSVAGQGAHIEQWMPLKDSRVAGPVIHKFHHLARALACYHDDDIIALAFHLDNAAATSIIGDGQELFFEGRWYFGQGDPGFDALEEQLTKRMRERMAQFEASEEKATGAIVPTAIVPAERLSEDAPQD